MREKTDKIDGFGPYLGLTFLIGLGFFTMGLMDPLYDSFLPIFLSKYIKSNGIIGTVMTLDNLFAIFLIPIVSVWSDRTRTPIGRRMPFILLTLPIAAICFSGIPWAAEASLLALILLVFVLNVFKQAARGPVVALMPDIIPGDYRSEANGVINTMGGIAAIVGTLALSPLMNLNITLPIIGSTKDRIPFPIAGVLVILATILLFAFIREKPASTTEDKKENKKAFWESLKIIAKDRSAVLILLSILCWFLGYQGVLPFVAKFSLEVLGTSKGVAGMAAGMVGIAYAIFAVPSGYVAHKLGRKKTIRAALVGLVTMLTLMFLLMPISRLFGLEGMPRVILFWVFLFFFGIFWVTVITNSFPMLWQMADFSTMGIYTGMYYTASQAAAIAAPVITGFIIDFFGYPAMFLWAVLCMCGAFALMRGVKKGEPAPEAVAA